MATTAKKQKVATENGADTTGGTYQMIRLSDLFPSPTNPRKTFSESELRELANSIRQIGLINPMTVRESKGLPGQYEVVSGGRRYRACIMAGILEAPCMIRELTDEQVLDLQIEENLHRQDVPPMEEAEAFQSLLESGRLSTGELAGRLNKSESYVLRRVKLNNLHEIYRPFMERGELSTSTAEVISRYTPEIQRSLFKKISFESGGKVVFQDTRNVREKFRWEACNDLSKAPWPLDRAEMQPGLPACLACPKNTAVATLLFHDNEGEHRCTDKGCWKVKETVWKAIALQEWEAHCEGLGIAPVYMDLNYYKDGDNKVVEKVLGREITLMNWREYDEVEEGTPGAVEMLMMGASAWHQQEKNFTRGWFVPTEKRRPAENVDWEIKKIDERDDIGEDEKQELRDEVLEKRRLAAEANAKLRMEKEWRLAGMRAVHERFTTTVTNQEALIALLRLDIRNSVGGYNIRGTWLGLFGKWAKDWNPTSFAIKVNGEGKEGVVNPKWTKGCISAWQDVLDRKKRKGDYETMDDKAWSSWISKEDKAAFIDTILLDFTDAEVISMFADLTLRNIHERLNGWNSEQFHLEYLQTLAKHVGVDLEALKPSVTIEEDDFEESDNFDNEFENDDDFDPDEEGEDEE